MNTIEIAIKLPDLWGEESFVKNEWGDINLLVGANGTGKSLFAEQLKKQLTQKGYSTRFLSAERLSGFEKQGYSFFSSSNLDQGLNISRFKDYKSYGDSFGLSTSAFVILKERLDIKIRIEAFLSDLFNKIIRLVEEGGFLKPKMQNIGGKEYGLKEQECHGLKELITLLVFLYDDSKDCLILDEPELHLHPQFQSFFLNEIRQLAGNPKEDPGKKIFFLITHSPYFLDLKTINDLKNVIVFQDNQLPSYIDTIGGEDEYTIKKFLPRFNTHHKQFFFSNNPVFVEGHTDQQLITLIYDKLGRNIGASGSCVIDVGGKDELGVFFKLCKKFGINPIIIADLDALFNGKLRDVLCEDERANKFIQDKGIGDNLSSEIGDLERKLKDMADDLISKETDDVDIIHLSDHLKTYIVGGENENLERFRLSMLLGLIRFREKIEKVVSASKVPIITFIIGRTDHILEAAKQCNIYFIDIGELEHHYTQAKVDYLNITNKDILFHAERDFILKSDAETIREQYSKLILTLENVIPTVVVDLIEHLRYELIVWIQRVQTAIVRGEVKNIEQLKQNARINYNLYNQIVEIMDFTIDDSDNSFTCKLRISSKLSNVEVEFEISEKTTAHNFRISN
jgi:hypothetical protein